MTSSVLPDQQRNLLACQLAAEARAFTVWVALSLRGAVDVPRLVRAVQKVRLRHTALHAYLDDVVDPPSVRFDVEAASAPVEVVSVLDQSPSDWLESALGERFDPRAAWSRVRIGRFADDHYGLLLALPRAACDAESTALLYRDLVLAYDDEDASFGSSLADFVTARSVSESAALADALGRLSGELPPLELPLAAPRPALFSHRGRTVRRALGADTLAELRALAGRHGVLLDDVILTVFLAALQRYSNQEEFVVATTARPTAWEGIGPNETVCVLRAFVAANTSFESALSSVSEAARAARAGAVVSFQSLVDGLSVPRDPSRTPLFQAGFEREPRRHAQNAKDGVVFEPVRLSNTGARTDVALLFSEDEAGLELALEYAEDSYTSSFAEDFLGSCALGLAASAAHVSAPTGQLPLLTPEQTALAFLPYEARAYDETQPVFVRLGEHARRTPERVAVLLGEQSLTYAELEASANRLAHRLRQHGVGPESLVGVYCERSLDMVVALLAAHKAGGAYVPLDPTHPRARVEAILEDAAPRVVVTQRALREQCPVSPETTLIDADAEDSNQEPATAPELDVRPDGLAYVIFTSGSTGRPKGVEITHRAFTNFVHSMARTPGLAPEDRVLSVTTLSFDIAGLELLLPIYVGASVEIADRPTCINAERLAQRLADPAVTLLQATPATFRMLVESGWSGSERLRVLCGGEAFPPDLVDALLRRTSQVWNMYGPTETTVWSTLQRLTDDKPPIRIGRPVDNTSIYVLNPCGQPVPRGSIGELWIGGDGVARGYRARPDLTAERFITDGFRSEPGARMYRTGDLGRVLADGTLECLGRVDFQVKIRGYRIELGDIETALMKVPGVREAVVVAREDRPGDKRLVAYFVGDATQATLRASLGEVLPSYMVPAVFVQMDVLPLNPSGKIDRRALPVPAEAPSAAQEGVVEAVKDDTEATIRAVFADVLGVASVDSTSSFFEMGGTSLMSVKLAQKLEAALGAKVPLGLLFEAPTVRGLAEALGGQASLHARPRVVVLRRGTSDEALFCVYGVALYQHVARSLPEHLTVYGVFIPTETEIFEQEKLQKGDFSFPGVAELARQYVSIMTEVHPEGPYRVMGISFGGLVAYEIARQLRALGQEVVFLGLLDALLPSSIQESGFRRWGRQLKTFVADVDGRQVVLRALRAKVGRVSSAPFSERQLTWLRDRVHDQQIAHYAKELPDYPGDAVIVRATDHSEYGTAVVDAGAGWRERIRGSVAEYDVPGRHLEIVEPPSSDILAKMLSAHLA